MRSRLFLACMCAALSVASQAQAAATTRFQVTEDPSEVLDVLAKLVWKRCVEGMTWDGGTCQGKAQLLDHTQASRPNRVEATRLHGGFTDRTQALIDSASNPAIDPVLFPHPSAMALECLGKCGASAGSPCLRNARDARQREPDGVFAWLGGQLSNGAVAV